MHKHFSFIHLSLTLLIILSCLSCAGGHRRPPRGPEPPVPNGPQGAKIGSDVPNDTIRFKFFLERSGSMTAYDAIDADGNFKAAIVDLLNGVPKSGEDVNMLLYIVNSGIFPYQSTYKDFAMCKDIFKETKDLGDPRYTDFTCIFDSILNHTKDNEISILVSDLIYSTSEMSQVNVTKILEEARFLTTTIFKGHNDMDVLLVKLTSDYRGQYYVYNKPNVGQQYSGQRPYYFVIVAKHQVMERIFREPMYANFLNFSKLNGYENYYLFESINAENPRYSILSNDPHNQATRFKLGKVGKEHAHEVHAISDIKPNRDGDVYITLAVDLGMVFMSDELKSSSESYKLKSKSGYEIDEIIPITKEMRKGTFELYAQGKTHLMVLHTTSDNLKRVDNISIIMPNELPAWIHESSSSDDTNIRSAHFASTTFALEQLCQGIYDAYYSSVEEPRYFELIINTK